MNDVISAAENDIAAASRRTVANCMRLLGALGFRSTYHDVVLVDESARILESMLPGWITCHRGDNLHLMTVAGLTLRQVVYLTLDAADPRQVAVTDVNDFHLAADLIGPTPAHEAVAG